MHADYACRHAGACCSSGWVIPLETTRVAAILRVWGGAEWLRPAPHAPQDVAGILATEPGGQCVFHRGPGCEIHRALGHDALPSACHFPRECLIDARGVSVTLSHYCPTALELLFEHRGAVEIVEGPPAVPTGAAEGLDARDTLPPLLTPGILMDVPGYAAWEAHLVRVLAGDADGEAARSPEQLLDVLEGHALRLTRWRPGGVSLTEAVHGLDVPFHDAAWVASPDWDAERRRFDIARESLPASHSWPDYPRDPWISWNRVLAAGWSQHSVVINRFLAAHAFASWMAYQGTGLRSIIERLRLALAVLRAEAIRVSLETRVVPSALKRALRRTDLLLVHLTDRDQLASRLSVPS